MFKFLIFSPVSEYTWLDSFKNTDIPSCSNGPRRPNDDQLLKRKGVANFSSTKVNSA
jgi:hypothetical protein